MQECYLLFVIWGVMILYLVGLNDMLGKPHPRPFKTPNSTLVLLYGQMRGGPLAWDSLEKELNRGHWDLATLLVGNISYIKPRAKWVWEVKENWHDYWPKLGGLCDIKYQGRPGGSVVGQTMGGVCPDHIGSAGILLTLRWIALQKLREIRPYDFYIFTRTDHVYVSHFSTIGLERDCLYIPEGEEYGGLTDRHIIRPRPLLEKALGMLGEFQNHTQLYVELFRQQRTANLEQQLFYYWQHRRANVEKIPRRMFTIRRPEDYTSGGLGERVEPFWSRWHVLLKYPTEWELAKKHVDPTYITL